CIDLDPYAHAGAQVPGVLVRLEYDPHRDTLHHLHPVTARILRRQNGELRAGARADGADRAAERVAWKGIDSHRDVLANAQIGDVGFLWIGIDPEGGVVDQAEHGRAGDDEAAELDVVDLGRGAGDRRAQYGVAEIAFGLLDGGFGLAVCGKILN